MHPQESPLPSLGNGIRISGLQNARVIVGRKVKKEANRLGSGPSIPLPPPPLLPRRMFISFFRPGKVDIIIPILQTRKLRHTDDTATQW